MKVFISLAVLVVLLAFYVTPKTIQMVFAQTEIPLQDVEPESNNTTQNETGVSGIEQMGLKAQLKPHENEFFADEGYYQIEKFGFVSSNGSEICPSDNCKYSVENGELSALTNMSGRYGFEGKLKVTTVTEDVSRSKFYDFAVYLDKTGEEERNGETVEILEGTFGLGSDIFNPEISYDITNATLKVDDKNPILTIEGERSPF
jgi:hypothetical protein